MRNSYSLSLISKSSTPPQPSLAPLLLTSSNHDPIWPLTQIEPVIPSLVLPSFHSAVSLPFLNPMPCYSDFPLLTPLSLLTMRKKILCPGYISSSSSCLSLHSLTWRRGDDGTDYPHVPFVFTDLRHIFHVTRQSHYIPLPIHSLLSQVTI